ncbi:MAG: hypothetical protein AB7O98_06045 [Hyphomonadaceae bacterium]
MKLRAALVLSMALVLAACGGTREGRTIELPGGVDPDAQQEAEAPNFFDRLIGNDPRPNVGPCPLMGVLYDNARIVDFAAPNNERYANIEFTGEMQGVRGLCRYVDADPIRMGIEIEMAFGRGPASTSDRQTYRYWVAVTRRGRAPIAKEYFDVDVRFDRGELVVTRTEQIENIVIPRANPEISGENFEILVGFELTPEQLQFNRDGKRFRIDSSDNVAPGQ